VIIDWHDSTWLITDTGVRDTEILQRIPGCRYYKSADEWRVKANLASLIQLKVELGDEPMWSWRAKLSRKALLSWRKRRMLAKKGGALGLYDPRLAPRQQWLQAYLSTGSAVVGWDMGTGKTPIVCSTIALLGYPTALILTTKTTLYWWAEQIEEWTDLKPFIFHGTKQAQVRKEFEAYEGPKALISSHGLMRKHTSLEYWKGATKKDDDEKEGALFDQWYDVCVVDESHKVGLDPSRVGVRAYHHLWRNTGVRWALSGTPIENSHDDFWVQLRFAEPDLFPHRGPWRKRYCIVEEQKNGGVKNLGLHPDMEKEFFWIADAYFDRQLKREALTDLPAPLEPQYLVLPMEPQQAKAYRELVDEGMTITDGNLIIAPNQLDVSRLCGYAANGIPLVDDETGRIQGMRAPSNKLSFVLEMLNDRDGDPFVVYAHSPKVIDMMLAAVRDKGYRAQAIIGDTPAATRQDHATNFQAGNHDVLFLNEAGAEGLTLTRADTIVFVQPSWRAITNQQARDRIDRWGQERQCHFIYLISANTVDETRRIALDEKVNIQEQVLRDRAKLKAFLTGTWTPEEEF